MTIETTLRKRHRTYFNHVSPEKLATITKARDEAVYAADKRNDERVLTLIRKHLKQFNLQNHEVFVLAGSVHVTRKCGRPSHASAWYWGEVHLDHEDPFESQITLVLHAAQQLRLHNYVSARVA